MSYTKIYYDDIWEATSKSSAKCNEWLPSLQALSESFAAFIETESFKGQAATNMKSYLEQVHGILISIIGTVVQSYSVLAVDYYGGYTRIVDSGDSKKYGLRYTTIVNGEVSETGSIQSKLNDILRTAEQVVIDANSVKSSISDLVSIASYPKTYNLYEQINAAKSKAQTVHNNAIAYESSRANDFTEIDRLISQALSIITTQLSKTRVSVIAYQKGSIGNMCDINQIVVDLEATSEKVSSITENEYFEEDASLVLNRDALIQEEEEASREWAQWVAVGVAVVGAIALTVVTAGGAAPLVCASVGAVAAAAGTASSLLADEYVEKGNFDEMDWSEFGEDVAAAAVGGFVGGYLGAVSQGSAIKQPIEKGMSALANTVVEKTAEGVTATIWETGETIYEVGDAIVAGKPGDEILSVLDKGLGEMEGDLADTFKEALSEGAESFVGGTVAGSFDVDTSDKSVLQKIGEKAAEGAAGGAAKGTVNTIWGVGEALVDGDSSTTVTSALKEGVKETVSDIASSATSSVVSEGVFSGVDDIDNKAGKVVAETVKDTVTDTVENVTEGVVGRTMDYVYGDEKDASKILGDIWEEDLESGRTIVKAAGESAGEHITDEVYKDDKYYNDLKKIDKDGDGKITFVQFDDYAVTKQDYDAAVENAGKGAYKDKTVQDILGLSHDTDISSGKEREWQIDHTREHESTRKTTDTVTIETADGKKYTYSEKYYESALNAAGKDEYKDKSIQELLDMPEATDLSDTKITHKRVKNEDIGRGEKVQFTTDYGTNATKIHISNLSREEMEKREEEKKAVEAAKQKNK